MTSAALSLPSVPSPAGAASAVPASLASRVVLVRCRPGDRWRVSTVWIDGGAWSPEDARRDLSAAVGGAAAVVLGGRVVAFREGHG